MVTAVARRARNARPRPVVTATAPSAPSSGSKIRASVPMYARSTSAGAPQERASAAADATAPAIPPTAATSERRAAADVATSAPIAASTSGHTR